MKEWIGYYEDVLSNELSKNIITDTWDWKPSTYSTHEGISPNSKNKVVMDDCWITEKMKYWVDLLNATKDVVKLYQKKHPYMKYFAPNRCTDFRVNKYEEGGFMSEHSDGIHHSHGQEYGFPEASLLFFLNDGYEGGEFIVADTMYKPKRNSAIIFPSNFMFPHEAGVVTKGTRWSIVTWLM